MSSMAIGMTGSCDICGTREDIAGYACSGLGPVSYCYCVSCLQKNAEPYHMMLYTYVEVGSCDKNNLAHHVHHMKTWKDGNYLSFDEFIQQLDPVEIKQMQDDMETYYQEE